MLLAPIDDIELQSRTQALQQDGISRFTLLDGSIRGAIVSATALSIQARANHGLGVLESMALSQTYMCALLASVTLKGEGSIGLRMDCTGPLRGYSVECDTAGKVRGYLFSEGVHLDRPIESFDLKPFIQQGTLSVIRRQENSEPFTGHVELVHGRIAEDVSSYFLRSEQIPTVFAVSVQFDRAGQIAGCGGLMLQAMPGAKSVDIEDAEDRVGELPSLGAWFSQGHTRKALIEEWYGAFSPVWMGEGAASFSCACSRERFGQMLHNLRGGELEAMIAEGPHPAELVCHNCGSRYQFSREELEALR